MRIVSVHLSEMKKIDVQVQYSTSSISPQPIFLDDRISETLVHLVRGHPDHERIVLILGFGHLNISLVMILLRDEAGSFTQLKFTFLHRGSCTFFIDTTDFINNRRIDFAVINPDGDSFKGFYQLCQARRITSRIRFLFHWVSIEHLCLLQHTVQT